MKIFKMLDDNNLYPMSYNNALSDIPISRPPCNQPIVTDDPNYLQGYLNSLIDKFIKVEFLIGTNLFIDKEGILKQVGVDYIVLEETQTGNNIIADLYSIKFVDVPESPDMFTFNPNSYRSLYER